MHSVTTLNFSGFFLLLISVLKLGDLDGAVAGHDSITSKIIFPMGADPTTDTSIP
jgi:hypothetical protein